MEEVQEYDRQPDLDRIIRVLSKHTGQEISSEQAHDWWREVSAMYGQAGWLMIASDDHITSFYDEEVKGSLVVQLEVKRRTRELRAGLTACIDGIDSFFAARTHAWSNQPYPIRLARMGDAARGGRKLLERADGLEQS